MCNMDGSIKIDLPKEVHVKLCIVSGYKRKEFVGICVRCTVHLIYIIIEMSNEIKVSRFANV
jgi:hypothetical protein